MHILEVVLTALAMLGFCALLLNAREIIEVCVDWWQELSGKMDRWWKRVWKQTKE